jgi:hypothetical protein
MRRAFTPINQLCISETDGAVALSCITNSLLGFNVGVKVDKSNTAL